MVGNGNIGMTHFFFDYCCLCIPLRIGAVIIGYLSTLECIVIAIKCLLGKEHEMLTLILLTPNEPPEQIKCHGMTALCICRAMFNIFMIVLCVRLIHGISKGIPNFMTLWMITYLLVNLMELVLLITALIWIGGTYLPFYFLFISMRLYCLFIVYRYYLILCKECDCCDSEDGESDCCDPECQDDLEDNDSHRRSSWDEEDTRGPNDCSDNDARGDTTTDTES